MGHDEQAFRMTPDAEQMAIMHLAQRLSLRFPKIPPVLVARVVRETYNRYGAHPSREFVPILVEDVARDRLRVLGPVG